MGNDVIYDVDEHIAQITLNRPESRNAYSSDMAEGIISCLDRADENSDIRAVLLTGAGSAFCAGGDIKAMRDKSGMFSGDPVELRDNYLKGLHQVPRRFDAFEKPVIAAINGPAVGAGLDLALMCDIRICDEDAKFGSTFAKVGVIPGDGGVYLLSRVVGFARAVELILTARIIDAEEALQMDMVTEIAEGDVIDRANEMAKRIGELPPKAVKMAKAALYRCADQDLDTSLQLTAALQSCIQHTDEHQRAVTELIEKLQG